jgi:hypothetical protein
MSLSTSVNSIQYVVLLTGFSFGVEALKSIILTLCCVERHISVERAVLLSRLEEEFQVK